MPIHPVKGSYILILQLDQKSVIQVGRLGEHTFGVGVPAYAGSALGPGGRRGRLRHHLTPVERPHWHIDYLRQMATLLEIWQVISPERLEHALAALLRVLPGAVLPVPGFGSSDCTCASHLFGFPAVPSFESFRELAWLHQRLHVIRISSAL